MQTGIEVVWYTANSSGS